MPDFEMAGSHVSPWKCTESQMFRLFGIPSQTFFSAFHFCVFSPSSLSDPSGSCGHLFHGPQVSRSLHNIEFTVSFSFPSELRAA